MYRIIRKRRKSIWMGMRTRKLHMFSSPIYLALYLLLRAPLTLVAILCTIAIIHRFVSNQNMFHFLVHFFFNFTFFSFILLIPLTDSSILNICAAFWYFRRSFKKLRKSALEILVNWEPEIRNKWIKLKMCCDFNERQEFIVVH